jgi:beta-1,3-galactosyltransferase 1
MMNGCLVFLIGNSERIGDECAFLLSYEVQNQIFIEQKQFGDIVQVELVEHYNNLTLKSVHMLKLFNTFYKNSTKFLVKADDDSFINLPNLSKFMISSPPTIYEGRNISEFFIMGHLFAHPLDRAVHRAPADRMNQKYVDKWITPHYLFNDTLYPQFTSGSCYVMTNLAAECLFEKSLNFQFFHLEDVFVTGIVAEACNLPRLNHPSIKT